MPDVIDPPAKPFSQQLRDSLPANDSASRAAQAAPPEPPKPKPADAPPPPPAGKPAPSAAPVEDDARRDAEIASGKSKPVATDWDRKQRAVEAANKRSEELKAKHEAAERELGELRKTPKHNAELIKSIESERDELRAKWQSVAAQFDSGFHAKYDAKVSDAIAKIKDAVPADKLNDLAQVLQMPDGERKRKIMAELTEDMDAPTVTDIMLANREVRDIIAARNKELADSGTILKASAEQRQKQAEERKTAYAKSFDAVLAAKSTGDDALPVLQTKEGDTDEVKEWNQGVIERKAVARKIFMDELSPEDKAEAAIMSASAGGLLEGLKLAKTKIAALEETLGKMQSTSPGILSGAAKGGAVEKTFTQEMMERAM